MIAPSEQLPSMHSRTTCGILQKNLFAWLFSIALWTPLSKLKWHPNSIASVHWLIRESRQGNGFKTPRFPEKPPDDYDLSYFVGKDSWSFFKILRIGHSFFHLPGDQWNDSSDWRRAKTIIDVLCAVLPMMPLDQESNCQDF